MDFNLDEESTLLKNSAGRYLQEKRPVSSVIETVKEEAGFSKDAYKEIADLGWLGLIYDENYGGSNGKFLDLFILFEEIGKVLMPSPFLCSAVFAGQIINEAGSKEQKDEILPAIIAGEKIFTEAFLNEKGQYDGNAPGLKAKEAEGGAYIINGTRTLVPYANVADAILVLANVGGSGAKGPTVFMVDAKAEGLQATPLDAMTGEKKFVVTFENVKVPEGNIIGEIGKGNVYQDKVFPEIVMLKCGEMAGGLQAVVDMTVQYVKERSQFGKPLGTLQAVQHFCAEMATLMETSRLAAYQAASLYSDGVSCDTEISVSKAWISDAYKKCTQIAQQVHGGIGFTEEHDLHLYYKHAKVSEISFGNQWHHRAKVAADLGI